MRVIRLAFILLFLAKLCHAQIAKAELDIEAADKKLADMWHQHMVQNAKSYEGIRESDRAIISPMKEPLLKWTNPQTGVRAGLLVGWQDEKGIPVAIAQIFSLPPQFGDNVWSIEMQSLSKETFELRSGSALPWKPNQPGVVWQKFPGKTLKPASSKRLRLVQMRQLAGRLRGDDQFEDKEQESVLRLLRTPVMRYEDADSGIIDGAIFVLAVSGTDPEVIIMMEHRTGHEEYQYALAPMTGYELNVYLDKKNVWHKPTHKAISTINDVFVMRRVPSMKVK